MEKPLFTQRKRQLRALSLKLARLVKSMDSSEELIQKLKDQIRKLLHQMRFALGRNEVKRLMGTAALILGLSFGAQAQSFGPKQNNPFNIQPSSMYFNMPSAADMDNDGDLDLITLDDYGVFYYYENNGTASNAAFLPPVDSAFGLPALNAYAFPSLADLDGDGDIDIMVGYNDYYSYSTHLAYFENIGNSGTPLFAAQVNEPYGIVGIGYGAFPTFSDIDGDGDLDLFVGDMNGDISFFQNSGTASNPQFSTPVMNPFGLTASLLVALPAFGDLDEDGDLDLLVGQADTVSNNTMRYFQNTGTASSPQFSAGVNNPFGINAPSFVSVPILGDFDDDADLDILTAEYYGGLAYYENTSSFSVDENKIEFELYPNPVVEILEVFAPISVSEFQILDMNGRKIISTDNAQINVSTLAKGVYMIRIIGENGAESIQSFEKL